MVLKRCAVMRVKGCLPPGVSFVMGLASTNEALPPIQHVCKEMTTGRETLQRKSLLWIWSSAAETDGNINSVSCRRRGSRYMGTV